VINSVQNVGFSDTIVSHKAIYLLIELKIS
jgi:hypothetical protein